MENGPMPRICRQCGRPIVENYGFCPACGLTYEAPRKAETGSSNIRTECNAQGPTPDEQERMQQAYFNFAQNMQKQMLENNLSMAIFMLWIWIIMGSIFAVMCFLVPDDIAQKYTGFVGLGKQMMFEGTILVISVAFAVVSLIFCKKKANWKIACYSCLVSTLVPISLLYVGDTTGIYFLLCGLLCTLRIKTVKTLFTS